MSLKSTVLSLLTALSIIVLFSVGTVASAQEKAKVLIQFEGPIQASDKAFVHGLGGKVKHEYALVPGMAIEVPETALKGLRNNPRVLSVEEDVEVQAVQFEDEYAETWSINNIDAKPVHNSGNTGVGVKVGIIDSGVDYTHRDLADNYVGGWDFTSRGGKGDADPMDVYGHGTHVAGTVCAEMDNGGAVGVAPNCELYALRVLDSRGIGQTSNILAAVEWAVKEGLDVINLSLGSSGNPGSYAEAVYDAAYDSGVLIVAAAGNSYDDPNNNGSAVNTIWPANYSSVIAVAATDINDNRAYFSSTGPNVEIAAPGYGVHSTWNDGTSPYNPQPVCDPFYGCYKDASGTSMASPQVAGVAALIIAAGIIDTSGEGNINDEVRSVLQSTAVDLAGLGGPGDGKDTWYGYGLVDAAAAVNVTTGPQAPVANAGGDQTYEVLSGELVSIALNGSGSDANNDPLNFYWTGGDIVGTSTGALYESDLATGTYEYTLTVSDGSLADTDTVVVTVTEVVPNQLPTASFTFSTSGPDAIFADASSDPDGSVVSWSWSFGDGNTAVTQNPSHTYTTSGTYTVDLKVTDDRGATDTASQDVTIEVPVPDIVLSFTQEKVRGTKYVYLSWTPIDTFVDVYRDGQITDSNNGTGVFEESLGKGGGSYIYQVCETGGMSTCSDRVSIAF